MLLLGQCALLHQRQRQTKLAMIACSQNAEIQASRSGWRSVRPRLPGDPGLTMADMGLAFGQHTQRAQTAMPSPRTTRKPKARASTGR